MNAFRIGQIIEFLCFFFWELPQNILGLLMLLYFRLGGKIVRTEKDLNRLFIQTTRHGISLGYFVFWCAENGKDPYITRKHEYGHTIQSRIFGPLYLLLIGLPSISRYIYAIWFEKKFKRQWTKYYRAYPENWADELGKVNRL